MSETTLPPISSDSWADRIAAVFPNGWAGLDATHEGQFSSLLLSMGTELGEIYSILQYVLLATRLLTETAPELDLAGEDFFDSFLSRQPGQSDADYAQTIIANLFKSAATRPAIAAGLLALTGVTPRMLEPWSIFDTGQWTHTTYWDHDDVVFPGRWGAPELRYQGFVETAPAQIPALGPDVPILGFDTTAYWDTPGYFFGEISANPAFAVEELISALKAEGTTVWVKLVNAAPPPPSSVAPAQIVTLTLSNLTFNSVQTQWIAPSGTVPLTYTVQFRPTGTTTWQTGATTGVTSAVLVGLSPVTSYDFQVVAANSVGSSTSAPVVSASTLKQPPGPATNLLPTVVTTTAITVTWSAPATGTAPFSYVVLYRVAGTVPFSSLAVGAGSTAVTIINLAPATKYDIEVQTSNL